MPRISPIVLFQQKEQPSMAIRAVTDDKDLPQLIGTSYGKLMEYFRNNNVLLADIPYVGYFNMDMSALEVELAFPICEPLVGNEEIKPSSIPAGKYVACVHAGAYDEIEATYHSMMAWIKENNLEPLGIAYESYFNGPDDCAVEHLITRVALAVR